MYYKDLPHYLIQVTVCMRLITEITVQTKSTLIFAPPMTPLTANDLISCYSFSVIR